VKLVKFFMSMFADSDSDKFEPWLRTLEYPVIFTQGHLRGIMSQGEDVDFFGDEAIPSELIMHSAEEAIAKRAMLKAWLALGIKVIRCVARGTCNDGPWLKTAKKLAGKVVDKASDVASKLASYHSTLQDLHAGAKTLFGDLNELQTIGLVVQAGFVSGLDFSVPVMVSVEVIWGRAYLAHLDVPKAPIQAAQVEKPPAHEILLFRNHHMSCLVHPECEVGLALATDDRTGTKLPKAHLKGVASSQRWSDIVNTGTYLRASDCFPCGLPNADEQAKTMGERYGWILEDELQLKAAFELAEVAAQRMGADELRVDVFLKKGEPAAAAISEIHLFSELAYRRHDEFMAKLWWKGHMDRSIKDNANDFVDSDDAALRDKYFFANASVLFDAQTVVGSK